jgi:presequence protease
MKAGDASHGFTVLGVRDVPEYRCRAIHLRHDVTGLEALHLAADDRENLFAFAFTTPPGDDTGVTHIVEHSVLSGSRRFPLKEPFSILMKGSMHTFLNAFTYPDRTVYPASSLSPADYFNLMLVYGDAVFFPLLRKETFMQEAWRLEKLPPGQEGMRFAGIVFNEMKGAYSSPESVVAEWAYRSLFPDTPYRFDSGGDPLFIPTLTLDGLRSYHARYYHPSNCRVFLYGNIPTEENLRFLQEQFLRELSAGARAEALPLQPRWREPRRVQKSFPSRPGSPVEGRSTVCMSWLTADITRPGDLLAQEVLADILIGSAGSPLRKRLVDSGLGQDLSPASGLETEMREAVFSAGLRGTDAAREGEISGLVLESLAGLARSGIDRGLIESTINRVEFRNREIRGGGGPYALRLMRRALRGWVHGADPVDSLAFSPVMEGLKSRLSRGPRLFDEMVEQHLVGNPHRATILVSPDPAQEVRDGRAMGQRLDAVVSGMGEAQRRGLDDELAGFAAFQQGADSPEDLARIPSLSRSDLPAAVENIPTEEGTAAGSVPVLLHDVFTNDIVYVDLCFPLAGLPEELSPLMPIFCRAITGSGLPGVSYADIAVQLYRLTGGFFGFVDASGVAGDSMRVGEHAFFRLRALRGSLRPALELAGRLLAGADFRDSARLRDMTVELRNDLQASLIPAGHQYAALRAAGMLSPAGRREETWKGVSQLLALRDLCEGLEAKLPRLADALEDMRGRVIRRQSILVNVTAPKDVFPEILDSLSGFCGALPAGPSPAQAPSGAPLAAPAAAALRGSGAESLVTSTAVGYVARAIAGFRFEEEKSASQAVLGHLLSTGMLWETVRMEGGAYGASAYARSMDGIFLFSSARDPHIVRTLRAFRQSLAKISSGGLDGRDVDRAVIGVIGRDERPLDPGEKGFVALQRRLYGITDGLRQARRTRVLAAGPAELRETARALLDAYEGGASVVISSRAAVEAAGKDMAELAENIREIPE